MASLVTGVRGSGFGVRGSGLGRWKQISAYMPVLKFACIRPTTHTISLSPILNHNRSYIPIRNTRILILPPSLPKVKLGDAEDLMDLLGDPSEVLKPKA